MPRRPDRDIAPTMARAAPRSAVRTRDAARGGFVWRHLVGDYSLARSFWVHLVLFGWCLALAAAWGLSALAERSTVRSSSIAMLALEPLFILIRVWARPSSSR